MKKRVLSLVLTLALVVFVGVAFSACGEKANVEVMVGNEKYEYETLTEAIATEETTEVIKITLNKDMVLTEAFHITNNTYEINLNGHNVSFPSDTSGDGIFWVENNAKLTLNGNGTVDSASQNNDYSMAVWARNGGEVIINGGTYTNVGARDKEVDGTTPNNNELIYSSGEGKVTINGGTFIGNYENQTYGTRYTLNVKDQTNNNQYIVVKGGEYREYDPANSLSENPKGNFVASGYKSTETTKDGATWFVVTEE